MEFKKSGYNDAEAATLSKIASEFQNVADSQLSAGDSATFLISQMKAFNIEAQDSEHIIDAVNEVSNNFAVSSTDISSALSKTSSAMGVLGNSFEETIGLVTGAGEIMQNQAKFYWSVKTTLIDGELFNILSTNQYLRMILGLRVIILGIVTKIEFRQSASKHPKKKDESSTISKTMLMA